ncbi:MAG: sporulation integral membrane protein YtvI [Firmicutes bacterium]|nr:sporulation integral membrane protein YtvI [Bacillota bacterium]
MVNTEIKKELYILGIIAGVFIAFKYLLPLFIPFIIGALLAIMIDPVVDWLEEHFRVPRGLSAFVVLILVVIILLAFIVTGITRLIYELDLLLQTLPQYQEMLASFVDRVVEQISQLYSGLPGVMLKAVESGEQNVYNAISSVIKQLLSFVQSLPNMVVIGLLSIIASFFFSRDKRIISKTLIQFVPRSWRKQVFEVKEDVFTAFSGFFRAQLILISMTAVMAIVGLTLLGVRYAWLLGLTAGIFDLIPMMGPSAVFLPLAGYFLVLDQLPLAIGVLITLGFILLVRQLSEPRIVGANIGLHPLATLIAIYLGFRLFGVSGFILGPLAAITIKAIFAVIIPEAF